MVKDKKIISSFGKTRTLFVHMTESHTYICDGYRVIKMDNRYITHEIKSFLSGKFLQKIEVGTMLKVTGSQVESGLNIEKFDKKSDREWAFTGLIEKMNTSRIRSDEAYIFESKGQYKYIQRSYLDELDIKTDNLIITGEGENEMLTLKDNMKYGQEIEYHILPIRHNKDDLKYLTK